MVNVPLNALDMENNNFNEIAYLLNASIIA